MDIDHLTLAQIKEISRLVGAPTSETRTQGNGRRVIVRSRDAGVQVGDLESYTPTEVVLRNARQMWSWKAARGGTLLDCATFGVDPSRCKFSSANDRVVVLGACAIIDVTPEANTTMAGVSW